MKTDNDKKVQEEHPPKQQWRAQSLEITPLHNQILSRLREMIVEGELAPGTRVPEKDLCAHFGISRTPLREALKVLATEDLVVLSQNRGATVTVPTAETVKLQFEVIAALEGYAARLVCDRGSDEQINDLCTLHKEMIDYQELHELGSYFRTNQQFHEALVRACGNTILSDLHSQASSHLRRIRFHSIIIVNQSGRFARQHERILRALVARNGARAQVAMQDHCRSLSEFVQAALQR